MRKDTTVQTGRSVVSARRFTRVSAAAVLALALLAAFGCAIPFASQAQTAVRREIPLDGRWLIATDPDNAGRDEQWFAAPRPEAKETRVPWIIQAPFPGYHGVAWYWHTFSPPAQPAALAKYMLRFWAVDYKADDWRAQLKAATPDGIDVDFENVGGEIMDAIFGRLNLRARVPLCGLISGYNDGEPQQMRAFGRILTNRVLIQGFIVLDHFGQAPEVAQILGGWMAEGRLKAQETVVEGFEGLPDAVNMLFDGRNVGKLVVKI